MTDFPTLLAVQTGTQACSLALAHEGRIWSRLLEQPRRHAQQILPLMEDLLQEAGVEGQALELIIYARGPGSFTGLRVGAAVVQALALAFGTPVAGVSSLQALAQATHEVRGAEQVAVALDARASALYWGCFSLDDTGLMQAQIPEQVVGLTAYSPLPPGHWVGVGDGWGPWQAALSQVPPVDALFDLDLRAEHLISLGVDAFRRKELMDPQAITPTYLRESVI